MKKFFQGLLAVSLLLVGSAESSVRGQDAPQAEGQAAAPSERPAQAENEKATEEARARRDINELFNRYQAATKDESGEKQIALYDVERLVEEIMTQADADWPDWQKQGMARVMQDRLQQQLSMINGIWYRHRIMRVDFLDDLNHAEVFVRSWTEDEWTNRQLIWIHRTDDGWRIYDVADLSVGIAYATMGAIAVREIEAGNLESDDVVALRTLMQVVQLMNEDDLIAASDVMAGLIGKSVPDFFESIRWFIHGGLAMQDGGEAALEYIEKAAAFQPDFPMLDYLRALAYNLMSRHRKAEFYARRYLERFGDDADAYVELAKSLHGRQINDEAIEMLQRGLEDTPNSLTAIELLAMYLPDENKQDFLEYFRALRSTSDGFQYLADEFEVMEETLALKVLVEEMARENPDEPLLDYYQGVVSVLTGENEVAMQQLQVALSKIDEDDDYRYYYQALLQRAAMAENRLIELYRDAEDPAATFEELVQAAIDEGNFDSARPVIKAHLEGHPDDARAITLAGDIEYYLGEFEAADELYARAWSCKPQDVELRDEIIYSRAMCWMELDRIIDGYRKSDPKDELFDEFADILSWDDRTDQIGELLELHRGVGHPLTIAFWDSWLKTQEEKADFSEMADQLQKALATLKPASDLEPYLEAIRVAAEDLLVRALIRSGQNEEALAVAKSLRTDEDRVYYSVLAHAAAGNDAALRESIRLAIDEFGYAEQDFLYDQDFPSDAEDLEQTEGTPEWMGRLRGIVMLLREPVPADSYGVIRAAKEAWGIDLFVKQKDELNGDDSEFVCQLTESAVIVGVNNFRIFIQAESEPLYGDAELLAAETENGAVAELVRKHRGWVGVDVYVWPQEGDLELDSIVPERAEQFVASLAVQLAKSGGASVARHRNTGEMCEVSQKVIDALLGDSPMQAFYQSLAADGEASDQATGAPESDAEPTVSAE